MISAITFPVWIEPGDFSCVFGLVNMDLRDVFCANEKLIVIQLKVITVIKENIDFIKTQVYISDLIKIQYMKNLSRDINKL